MEDPFNIRFTCDAHAPQPDSKFLKKPLKSFVGGYVKVGFEALHPRTRQPSTEHMWVKVLRVKKGKLEGTLDNDPIYITPLKCGDVVEVERSQIEEFLE